jgi:phosphopantetheinyl transferase
MDVSRIRSWAPAPETAKATTGVVDVWRADLAGVGDELEDLLCPQERERAARIAPERSRGIAPERNRVLWARSRGVLRALLARYLDADPRALRFVLGPHGKPALAREEAGPGVATGAHEATGAGEGLRFNLSHSGPLMLVAVTAGRNVGVDVERPRKRYTTEFLRAWVAHEAALKCRGGGLIGLGSGLTAAPPEASLQEGLLPEGPLRGGSLPGGPLQGALWTAELDAGPQAAAAAVAVECGEGLQRVEGGQCVEGLQRVEGGECELRCWEW